jgi:hypothetical protein
LATGATVFDVRRGEEFTLTERTDSADDTARRFDVELFLCARNIAPTAFGMEAQLAHHVGECRKTPKGIPLSGKLVLPISNLRAEWTRYLALFWQIRAT